MDKKEINLEPQEAPEKNTDKAFVRVNADGKPEMPVRDKESNERQQPEPGETEK